MSMQQRRAVVERGRRVDDVDVKVLVPLGVLLIEKMGIVVGPTIITNRSIFGVRLIHLGERFTDLLNGRTYRAFSGPLVH